MTTLQVTEFMNSTNSRSGAQMQMGQLPAVAFQTINITDASVQSDPFDDRTTFLRVKALLDCYVLVASNPTATTNHMHLSAGSVEYFGVSPGHRIAVIEAV